VYRLPEVLYSRRWITV